MADAARKKRPWTERFTMGLSGDLPDRAVPGPLKSAQLALAAPAESIRRGVGDFLSADSLPGDYLVPGGPMVGAMIRKQLGGLVNDPVKTGMEMTGYPAARRSMDAGRLALESEDPIEGAGRATRALGEGGLALAQVAGNAYGIGSNVTKLYRGKTPVATMPDPELAALQSRVAKAQTAGPSQIDELVKDAGARADAAYAKIKPVDWGDAPPAESPPRSSRMALEAEDAAPDGPKVYDPEDEAWLTGWDRLTPDELAEYEELAKSAAWHTPQQDARYYALGEKWDGRGARTKPALEGSYKVVNPAAAPPRMGLDMDPARKAELNAQIERLALEAEDAGKAGDAGKVGRAHTAIDDALMQAKREAAARAPQSPRLQEIRARLDAIEKEKRTVDGAWREEELDDEIAALMAERRQLLGKAPRESQGVTLSANGAQWGAPRTRPIRDYILERVDGTPLDEIAENAGKDVNSVRVMLSRERAALNKRLEAGETMDTLAEDYGVTPDVIEQFLVPLAPGRKPDMMNEIGRLARVKQEGKPLSNDAIATRLRSMGYDTANARDVATLKSRMRSRGADLPKGKMGRPRKSIVETGRNLALPLGMTYLQGRATQETMRENGYQMGLQ